MSTGEAAGFPGVAMVPGLRPAPRDPPGDAHLDGGGAAQALIGDQAYPKWDWKPRL